MSLVDRSDLERLVTELSAALDADPSRALGPIDALYRAIPDADHQGRATVGYLLGRAHAATGDLVRAQALVGEAERDFEQAGDRLQAIRTRAGLMQLLTSDGQPHAAIRIGSEGLDLLDALGSSRAVHEIRGLLQQNLGVAAGHQGWFQTALDAYDRAAAAYRDAERPERLPYLTANRAAELLDLGRVEDALTYLEVARADAVSLGAGTLVARCEAMIGWGRVLAGHPGDGIAHLRAAAAGFERTSQRADAELATLRLGEAHLLLSDWSAAAETFGSLLGPDLPVNATTRCAARTGAVAARIGRGQHTRAAQDLEEVIAAWEAIDHLPGSIAARLELAGLQLADGDRDAAIATCLQAHDALGPDGGDRYPVQMFYVTSRLVDALLPDHDAARHFADLAVELADHLGVPLLACRARRRLASVELGAGHVAIAETHLRAVIALGETLRARLPRESQRLSFGDDVDLALSMLTEILIDRGTARSVDEAAELADRRRDRVLRELLDGRVALDEAVGRATFRASLTALSDALLDVDSPPRAAALRDHVRGLVERGAAASPSAADASGDDRAVSERPARSSLATVVHPGGRRDRIRTDPGGTIIAYSVTSGRLVAFVTRDGITRAIKLATSGRDVADMLEELDAEVWQASATGETVLGTDHPFTRSAQRLMRRMGAALLDPLGHLLPRGDASSCWQVLPHGLLHDVPFHALIDAHGPLLEQATVGIGPNLSFATPRPARTDVSSRVVAVGIPTPGNPGVADELAAFGATGLPTEALIGTEATGDAVTEAASRADILHLAGHAIFDRADPRDSRLHLADGWLTADRIARLDLAGAVVIVSACEGARVGDRKPAGAAIGLARAFLAAGAHTVIASRWSLDDRIATETVGALARALAAGVPVNSALRQAQHQQRDRTPHIAHWAPFSALGHPDPRS